MPLLNLKTARWRAPRRLGRIARRSRGAAPSRAALSPRCAAATSQTLRCHAAPPVRPLTAIPSTRTEAIVRQPIVRARAQKKLFPEVAFSSAILRRGGDFAEMKTGWPRMQRRIYAYTYGWMGRP